MTPADLMSDLLGGPGALVLMAALVYADALLVVVPGEVAVTTLGALTVSSGEPPLTAVIAVAALAAWLGDLTCYLLGRVVGTNRWRWMRSSRVRAALKWAERRLDRGTASVLFTARFVPFARLAVNLVAGASRVHALRYLALAALAATGWAAYQSAIGAVVATLVPGGPVVAVLVSIVVALALGALIDAVLSLRLGRDEPRPPAMTGM